LDKVIREAGEYGQIAKTKAAMPVKLWKMLFGGPTSPNSDSSNALSGLDGDAEIVKRAIAKAFRGLDKEIVNTPIELLKEYELARNSILGSHQGDAAKTSGTRSLSSLAQSIFPISKTSDDITSTATQKSAYETLLPALSGSCALLTYVDSARGDVYVACTGDSRAVAGWWDHDKQQWHVEALSTDQTGRNLDEVKRMKSEHPAGESERVIMRGRVLGGLEPTRAFGDARYKWSRDLQNRLYDAFLPGGKESVRGAPKGLLTPPYVTAEPVVEWRRLSPTSPRELKFIIMATDGLWDELSSDDAVGLVAAHLSGFRGSLGASELRRRCFESPKKGAVEPSVPPNAEAPQVSRQRQHPLSQSTESVFIFEDDNLATHLTRNALGGANRDRVAGLLAIPAPLARRYRDDITVNVLLFNTRQQQQQQRADTEAPPKAKL
jgi:pyruvate dehydrogenase phosphatase